mmetsp:Transcript_92391/g.160146  ORF Transcript_92391/g.160146 Transcript_92391/m.160146 type:complete len:93 (+) Transcript_92391:801-1079(+)
MGYHEQSNPPIELRSPPWMSVSTTADVSFHDTQVACDPACQPRDFTMSPVTRQPTAQDNPSPQCNLYGTTHNASPTADEDCRRSFLSYSWQR